MTDDLAALRAVAAKATPGPWRYPPTQGWTRVVMSRFGCLWAPMKGRDGMLNDDRDGEHIATFDPPTVLALLDRLEAAEREREREHNARRSHMQGRWKERQRAEAAESRLATLQQKLTELADEWEADVCDCPGCRALTEEVLGKVARALFGPGGRFAPDGDDR